MMKNICTLVTIIHLMLNVHAKSNVGLGKRPLDGFMLKSEVPDTGEDWRSLSENIEFQISADFDYSDKKMQKTLTMLLEGDEEAMKATRKLESYSDPYLTAELFADNAFYTAYAQAWRYLGYYVDCDPQEDKDRRRMENNGGGCLRYLLWAAYVDPNYQGNGLGEYQFYDRYDDEWVSYCDDEDVCRKMDCHLESTDFRLIGFFKHADYNDWIEQLFKHEGVCVWTEDEYDFMSDMEDLFGEGCEVTEYQGEDGNYLYYDLRPMPYGDVGIGLYTDYRCSQLYEGDLDPYELFDGGNSNSGSGDNLALNETVAAYNDAFSIFKVCQPCVAYDLDNDFECDDEAGYTNVNQCMKFTTKCERDPATIADISLAGLQRTTVHQKHFISEHVATSITNEYINVNDRDTATHLVFFGASLCLFGAGVFAVLKAKKARSTRTAYDEPLVYLGDRKSVV